jgi:hypothetical protein
MPYEVTTNAFHEDVVSWLQENVGNLLWSRPIVEWHGRGWAMNSLGYEPTGNRDFRYIIKVDDPKLATLTALRWSS